MGKIQHRYEDYTNISIGYGNGRTAFIETNWLTPRRVRTLNVTGTEGILNVEYTTQEISLENMGMVTQPLLLYTEPLLAELQSFIDCVGNDTPPRIIGEDGLRALQICEAALKTAETKSIIRIKKDLK
jgi:UDP-N-acetylglucosamine 3-dehydrogenase